MIVFLLDSLDETLLDQLLDDNVLYRPDLLKKKTSILARALVTYGADAIVTSVEIPLEAIQRWFVTRSPTYQVHIIIGQVPPSSEGITVPKDAKLEEHVVLHVYGDSETSAYIAAFKLLEREFTRKMLGHSTSSLDTTVALNRYDKHVIMVGAGIVNLVTAHTLQEAGYKVQLIDCGPDPREAAVWTKYGCSRGGDDARMFSLSEMNNYHDKQISKTMNNQFRRRVIEQGWSIHCEDTLSSDEQRWIEDFESLPTWLALQYNEDIFGFNNESHLLWDRWKQDDPELFSTSLMCEGIVRLFSDPTTFKHKAAVQNRLGACRRLLSPDEIAFEHPMLADAVNNDYIAGGIDEIGFTIRLHEFMRQLLERLERSGVKFMWNQLAHRILFDPQGNVKGIQSTSKLLEASHYVISPGVYGNALLNGTRSHQKIHGVLGVWLRLPNINPQLKHSLKLRRTGHITEAANITISTDTTGAPILILGSGYGYTGVNPHNIDKVLLEQMYHGIVDTAQKYFPKAYQAAIDTGGVEGTFKYCVRPWTATGLGMFEMLDTVYGGKCIITGGHNTGGFAQSPAVAQAVLAALEGREHPMHHLYHPDRASSYLANNFYTKPNV